VTERQIVAVTVQRTLRWMERTRPRLKVLPAWVVQLDSEEPDRQGAAQYALIFPDGSYRVATLGQRHGPPKEAP
jgi:hypothetical protein